MKHATKSKETSYIFLLSGFALSLTWAMYDIANPYAILLVCVFALDLSLLTMLIGPKTWINYKKKYRKQKGYRHFLNSPRLWTYKLQMYIIFPLIAVVSLIGIIASLRIIF